MSQRKFALIIANYEFEDERLKKLISPAKDAEALANILKDEQIGGFDNINLQINKTDDVVRKEINSFFSKKLPDDMLLFYYSGHGVVDNRGRLYLTTKTTNMDLLRATAIPSSFITDEMDESRSKRQIWILDCCYSGAAIQGVKSGIGAKISTGILEGNGYGRVVLSATDALQLAWEGNQILGDVPESLFTHYFIEGITTGNASPFKEWISMDDIYDYIYRKIVPHQNPLKSSLQQEGELIVARNPKPRIKTYTKITGIPSDNQKLVGNSSIFGIDFGTTKSSISIIQDGKPIIIRNDRGEKFTPSVVAFMENGNFAVGTPAIVQAFSNPDQAFFGVKRNIEQEVEIDIYRQKTTYINVASKIFENLRNSAKKYCINDKYQAVLCTPAYFSVTQKTAIIKAATQAGFEILRTIPEPVSAALAYGVEKNDVVVVCDLGGGTFDISILEIGDGVAQVQAVNGDNSLGGIDFDNRIVDFLIKSFFDVHGIDISNDRVARMRLLDSAEQAKIALSELDATTVFVPNIYADQNGVKNINVLLSRENFEEITKDFVDKIEKCCRDVIADSWEKDIKKIIFVGLSTQIPAVKRRVQDIFKIPADSNIDPNDAVAIGAAIQGGVLSGNIRDVLLLDVVPISLGIETQQEESTMIIERNTTIPIRGTKKFTTLIDNQTSAMIHILQGEHPKSKDNLSLGGFYLDDIPPAPRGFPQIEVTFDVDQNGILSVTAKENVAGKQKKINITSSTSPTNNSNFAKRENTQIQIYKDDDKDKAKDEERLVE